MITCIVKTKPILFLYIDQQHGPMPSQTLMLSELQIFGALLAALPVGALAFALGKALYR